MEFDDLTEPAWPAQPVRRPAGRPWPMALVAFGLGVVLAGGAGWLGGADFAHVLDHGLTPRRGAAPGNAIMRGSGTGPTTAVLIPANAIGSDLALAGRVAAMEQRLDRVDLRVEAASGNAARAEALLVAFAVRRVVERGAPLGLLADQLKLRFGDAQPRAVATIIGGAREMVPLDQLAARLEALAPQLTQTGRQTLWDRINRQLSELLVVRRDRPAQANADFRFDDARKALSEGRIDDAVANVQHLSTGADAAGWSAAARRYRDVESALDLIDTTALLEPRQLRDGSGNVVTAVTR